MKCYHMFTSCRRCFTSVHTSNSPFVYLASGTLTNSSSPNSGKPCRWKKPVFMLLWKHSFDNFYVNSIKILRKLLTLKCQRVRTEMTMAVVVLLLPLEQLKTKAEWESSAKELFMASSSLSKSWEQGHTHTHSSFTKTHSNSTTISLCLT